MSTQIVTVPDIGDSSDVEVIEVMVSVGDEIAEEQSLIVLESDKASMEIPSSHAGKVTELKVAVGDKVSEGDAILVIEPADAEAPAVSDETVGGASAPVEDPEPGGVNTPSTAQQSNESAGAASAAQNDAVASPAEAGPAGGKARIEQVKVPDIGGAEGVTVIEVCVEEGAELSEGDPMVVLESDKASMEIPSPASGTVKALRVKVDDTVSEGSFLLDLDVAGDAVGGASAPQPDAGGQGVTAQREDGNVGAASGAQKDAGSSPAEAAPTAVPDKPPQAASDAPGHAVHAGPAVRRLAREFGVDLRQVTGSGRKGRIIKEDVQRYVRDALSKGSAGVAGSGAGLPEMPEVDFSKFGPVEEVALSKINKLSAANLHRSWLHVPHVTQFDEADITELEAFRKQHNATLKEDGQKLTPLAFIVKACASALEKYPRFNTSLHPSGEQLIQKGYIHIGVAVDTPDGLVVPVIRDANQKSITALARECGELAAKARKKRLSPADMSGGCFSISSLGGIGGTAFTPIVNAPEVAILGVSRSSMKPVYDGEDFAPRLMLPLSLSYDHRVIDGALAARFTSELALLLGDIRNLLL